MNGDPLPRGARLIHIGPHKTGSTALQSMCHRARQSMLDQGVEYVGRRRHEAAAIRWITGRPVAGADPAMGARRWGNVADALTTECDRLRFASSEFFSDASPQVIGEIVDQISAQNLYVAITLRPLAKILPSQYQQTLQRQARKPYDRWLETMLPDTPGLPTEPHFWVKHRHDQLVRRWSSHIGAENVVVVVLDSQDHGFLPRAFEDLLGLRRGTLANVEATENRSLTAVEGELLRRFNLEFTAEELGAANYARLLGTLKPHLKERAPESDEAKIRTPDWAIERANRLAREMADDIERSGARIIGDLASLSEVRATGLSSVPAPDESIDIDLAVRFAIGLAKGVTKQ